MDELELLREFRAQREDLELAHQRERARAVLLERIRAAEGAPNGGWAPRRHRGRRILPLGAAAAALVAVLVVPAVLVGPRGTDAQAAEALNRVAEVAAAQPIPSEASPGLGDYWYSKSESAYLSGIGDGLGIWALVPRTREIWIASDGSGRIVENSGEAIFFGDRDRRKWEEAGHPDLGEKAATDEGFGPGGLYKEDFDSYPTDPDALYELIRTRAEQTDVPVETEMLVIVGDLLRETAAPPELRSALYRVAARIPGIELIGEVTDPAGRRGTAVAFQSDHNYLHRMELVFDPETSELLAEREVLLERVDWLDAEPPAVVGYSVYLESGLVNSASDTPD